MRVTRVARSASGPAVDLRRTGEDGAECLHRAHARPWWVPELGQQRWVKGHPPATQSDQGPFRLGQLGDLVCV
jgi:hypothetical protein